VTLTGDTTRRAFATGRPLLETAAYKVHASRRDAPGQAEVHVEDTDIIYVLDGTATLVTGGEIVSPTRLSSSELRGTAISGGTARPLAEGDVIVVPHGTPHWFSEVHGPFLYYVVKTTTSVSGGQR
jgi:mannose-6-phosphate isomerase-like protein (cupin superfamily)